MQSRPEGKSESQTDRSRVRLDTRHAYANGRLGWMMCTTLGLSLASPAFAASAAVSAAESNGSENAPESNESEAATSREVLQEIVVTATRREEKLINVPASVTAITAQSIDALGIKDFNDIARFTPGVAIDNNTGTNTIAIRGISASAGSATTGVYIDDTPIQMRTLGGGADQALPQAFDLARVEVLRGPQGTLFGAGSEGGTVRYILTQPSDTVASTYARAEISHTRNGAQSYEAGVAHGGPIIDHELGFRVSAWFRQDGGWIDRLSPYTGALLDSNSNRQGTLMLRAALLWQPTSNLTITPSVLYQNRKRHNSESYWPIFSDPNADRYGTGRALPDIQPDRYYLPILKIQYDFGSMELISNTSYYNRRDVSGGDGTLYVLSSYQMILPGGVMDPRYPLFDNTGVHHVPADEFGYRTPSFVVNTQQNITQEVRLQSTDTSSPLTWTAGLYLETDRTFLGNVEKAGNMEDAFDQEILGYSPFTEPFTADGDAYHLRSWGRDRQAAVFGEATYKLGPVTFIAGGRFAYTWFDYNTITEQAFTPAYYSSPPGHQSSRPFTPRLGVQYHIDSDNMVYATYSTGFRVGGTNQPIPPNQGCEFSEAAIGRKPALAYGPDKVKSYEIGNKHSLFDNRVQIAGSLYYIQWHNIQQAVLLPSCGLQYTDNVGEAVSKGGDIQADFVIVPGLTLQTTAGYNSAYFTKSAPGNVVVAGDAVAGFASALPTWSGTLGLQYATRVLEHESFVRFDYQYRGVNNRLTPTTDPGASQYTPFAFQLPSSRFASLRAGVHLGDWEVDAFVDNLFDSHTFLGYFQTGLDQYHFPPPYGPGSALPPAPMTEYIGFRPRTVGVTAIFSR